VYDPEKNIDFLPMPTATGGREVGFVLPQSSSYNLVSPESELSFLDFFRVIKKRWRTVAAITGLFVVGAITYCILTPALYTAQTTLEIKGYAPVLSGVQSETLYGNDTRRIEYQKTTVAKLKLDGLADEVLSKGKIATDLDTYFDGRRGWFDSFIGMLKGLFRSTPDDEEEEEDQDHHFTHSAALINKYLSLIDVNPVHETNLVGISATTSDPELSQRIANTHGEVFIEHLRAERQTALAAGRELLETHADELKKRTTEAEQKVARYAEDNGLVSLSEEQGNSAVLRQIDQLSQLLADATNKRVNSESLLKELEDKGIDENSALDDEALQQIRVELKQAEAEYATLGQKVTAAYPAMVELGAKIAVLKKTVIDERRRKLRTLKAKYESELGVEERIREEINWEKLQAQDTAKRLIQYNILSKEASSLRDLYQSILRQVQESAVSAAGATSNIYVSDFATLPTSPSAPKSQLIIMAFGVLGFLSGVIVVMLSEHLDDTLKSVHEAQTALDLPLLGAVPSFVAEGDAHHSDRPLLKLFTFNRDTGQHTASKHDGGTSTDLMTDVMTAETQTVATAVSPPTPAVAEALRTIRANILLSSADRPPKVIMVTSGVKGDGKTTISSNLAVSLAQASRRTLVIDCDLRQTQLTKKFFPDKSLVGLSDLLAGQADLSEVIRPSTVPGLFVVSAGTRAPNPAELLGSLTMKETVRQLSDVYDFVIIDSPPVLPLADTLMLSRLVDGVIMVVRSNRTARHIAQEAVRRLQRLNAKVLGLVMTDVGSVEQDHFYGAVYGEDHGVGEQAVNS